MIPTGLNLCCTLLVVVGTDENKSSNRFPLLIAGVDDFIEPKPVSMRLSEWEFVFAEGWSNPSKSRSKRLPPPIEG